MLAALALAVLSFALTQGAAVPALPPIATQFGISLSAATWALSGNLAVAGICLPLLGRLGDIHGRRPVLLFALALVVLGGIFAGTIDEFGIVLLGRVIQGAGGGVFSLCFGLAREVLPARERARGVGILASFTGIGGALGLPVGGALIDASSYQCLFLTTAALSALALLGVLACLPRAGARSPSRLDLPGMAALTAVVTFSVLALGRAGDSGWRDPLTLGLAGAAVVALAALAWAEHRAPAPFLDIRTARIVRVALTNLVTFLVGAGNFAVMVIVTEYAQAGGAGLGVSATRAGLLLVPGSLLMVGVGVVSGRVTRRLGHGLFLLGGTATTTAGLASLTVWHSTQPEVALGVLVAFAGVAAAQAAVSNLIIDAVPAARTGEASGLNGLFRVVGAATGAQLAVAALAGAGGSGFVTAPEITRTFGLFTILTMPAVAVAVWLVRRTAARRVDPLDGNITEW
ncbi:MFS transporter [Saccharopolyspora sp. NPDC000995]